MRILCTSIAMRSHFFPMVPLAWALRAAGHEVQVAAQPPILAEVTKTGLPAVAVGAGYDLMTGIKEALSSGAVGTGGLSSQMRERVALAHARNAEAMVADLTPFARQWHPDLVLSEPTTWAAPAVAKAVGAPLVLHTWGPMPAELWADMKSEKDVRANWPKANVEFLDKAGVRLGPEYAACVVDPCPDALLAERMPNRQPERYVPYNGSAVAPPWLNRRGQRPRLVLTWGTTSREFMSASGPGKILDALAGLDVEVVATLSQAEQELLGRPRERVHVVDWMPLSMLLPTCDAIISLGGPGTVLAAAAYGVPQLVVPHFSAQPIYAELLSATGAGITLKPDDLMTGSICDAVRELLEGQATRDAARALREEIHAQPSPAEIVPVLESLVRAAPA
jgi:UDP:flavonoid glycosyltransferase YjiC (YdhE family)